MSVASVNVVVIPPPLVPTIVSVPPVDVEPVPVLPAKLNVVDNATFAAAVIRPFESTVKVGMFVAEPYEPAVTAVLASTNGTLAAAEPSTET